MLFLNRMVALLCFHQILELVNAPWFLPVATRVAWVGLVFQLSFGAAIFDSRVRVSKNMINPVGHLIM